VEWGKIKYRRLLILAYQPQVEADTLDSGLLIEAASELERRSLGRCISSRQVTYNGLRDLSLDGGDDGVPSLLGNDQVAGAGCGRSRASP
jgi:hypothetical protein